MKINLESNQVDNDKLELELNLRGKEKIKNVPKWILNAKTKNTEGLDYNKNNKKEKVYVDLPSSNVCTFCGKTGHLKFQCAKREQHIVSSRSYVNRIWIKKVDSCQIDKEPKKNRVPNSNN